MSKERSLKTYGFTKTNLVILLASILLIVIGYILMAGGKSNDGVSFDPEVFNSIRIGVAPALLTIGYVGILVAVLWRDKRSKAVEQSEEGSDV
ncbi:MAG: DUF3098 domain-containing protein [Bacteroidales bacterium]|uniref:DUF3098 domain-containing protein n=1 Tax=Porphyromonas sp. TaxID=1924944 RepID=UPI002975545F|nr:DUF3098 domain-containing protein [Porphyromonas sp.]MDD7438665.1 DUF3098 domain-containing protein [Bacteroidales bacterium]MDY3066923.1 DUF3098 domain-containing protein [Porphyromonas sp.]